MFTCARETVTIPPQRIFGSPASARGVAFGTEGLPHLSGSDLLKVQIANTLYKAAIELLEVCRQLGICISIENPLRSWLWMLLAKYTKETNNIQLIQWYSELECVTFDACAHGVLATHGVFSDLEQDCPSNHQHASWTPFQLKGLPLLNGGPEPI